MSKTEDKKKPGPATAAEPKQESSSNRFIGKLVSMTAGKLVMTGKDGAQHSHTLAKDAKVTCDGKACKADELKTGDKVRVTTKKDDRNVATGVESLNKNADFAQAG